MSFMKSRYDLLLSEIIILPAHRFLMPLHIHDVNRGVRQMAKACFESLLAPVKRVAGLDVPMPYSRKIEQLCIPRVETIIAAIRAVMA